VPGRSPHRSGQRRAAAAAHGRGRRRRLRYRTRRQNRSAPPLHRRLPLGAIRLRSRRDDSLRHTRQPGVHAPETGGALPLRLARPSGGHHSPLLLLHHRQRRREHDGQTPLVRHDDLLPDPAVHGEQDPGTVQGADEQNRSVLQDRRGPPAGGIDRREKDRREDGPAPRPAAGQPAHAALHCRGDRPHRKLRRGDRQRKDDRTALYDGRSLLAGEDPFVGNGHERRPDRIQRSGPRPPARKGSRHAAQEPGILHAALSGTGQTTGPPDTQRTESRRRTGLPRSGNHPGEARRSAHDPHSAPARYDDGPRSYSYGIYGRSKTRSAGHRRSGAYRDEYPELQTGAGGESGNGDALDSERSGGRIRRTDFGRRCRGQSAGGAYGPQPLCCERRDHPVRTGLGQGQGAGGEYARTIQENARRLSAQSQLHLLEQ